MTNDKHCDIHHIIYSIINIKKFNYSYNEKKYLLNNTSCLLNNMKNYIISKKKTELKTSNKILMRF
jgi:hypothetical protein